MNPNPVAMSLQTAEDYKNYWRRARYEFEDSDVEFYDDQEQGMKEDGM
jgi:hypothetical protein